MGVKKSEPNISLINKEKQPGQKMKLSNTFVFIGAAMAQTALDGPTTELKSYLTDVYDVMDVLVPGSAELKWRVRARKQIHKVAAKMIGDYTVRKMKHGCDPEMDMNGKLKDVEEDNDHISNACKEKAADFSLLAKKTKYWSDTWNACGNGRDRRRFRARMWGRVKDIRDRMYPYICEGL